MLYVPFVYALLLIIVFRAALDLFYIQSAHINYDMLRSPELI